MSEKIPARFRKTKSDKWAVMAPVEDLERALAGDGKIEVLKRSGDWSSFTVVSLGRPFDVDGVKMCYGYADDGGDETDAASPGGDDRGAGGGEGGGGGLGDRAGGGRPGGERRSARRRGPSEPPPRDETEPMPEFQGGPDDEWHPDF
jgi:hypothetical protein